MSLNPQAAMIAQAQQEFKARLEAARHRRTKVSAQVLKYRAMVERLRDAAPETLLTNNPVEQATLVLIVVNADQLEDAAITLQEELDQLNDFITRAESPIQRAHIIGSN